MRTKTFVLYLLCIVSTSVLLILFRNQRPSIQTLVTETHKQLNNLKNFKENLVNAEEKKLVTDEKYLNLLGFVNIPRLYPDAVWHNTSLPIIITYVWDGEELQGVGFARNIAHFLPNHTLLIYNLGLDLLGLQTLTTHCNSSRCQVIPFDLEEFPSHVQERRFRAFRPLIIQDALNKAGATLFLECDQRLLSGSKLKDLSKLALTKGGILGWPTRHASSSLTHPKMFEYFSTSVDNFFFLPMVDPIQLLLFNLPSVHRNIMLPWVQCALTRDCIRPLGAQAEGCRFNKKPMYRYTGCHRYDASALNIVLGLEFNIDETRYTYLEAPQESLFRTVTLEQAETEFASLEANVTERETSLHEA